MLIHIFAELLKLTFKEGLKESNNSNSMNGIVYDKNTKIDILKDQFKKYFTIEDGQEKMNSENYIQQILTDLKNDFSSNENKTSLLDDILFELKYNCDNKKSIQKILSLL